MRVHTANELIYRADILGADGVTVLATALPCGLESLTGKTVEQPQLSAAVTTHMILVRAGDASVLTDNCYIRINSVLYIVDFRNFPNTPRPGTWVEVNCHVERSGN